MYSFEKTKSGIIIGLIFVLNLFFVPCLFAGQPKNITSSNIKASKWTQSWNTDSDEKARINYGITPALGNTAEDIRGSSFEGRIHYLNIESLSPETVYYYDIIAGETVYDNNGEHWTLKTSGYLEPFPDSDIVYGRVFEKDGITPAKEALVYIKVKDNNDEGTPDESQVLTCLTDKNGYWWTELKNARNHTFDRYFDYSQEGDLLIIEVRGPAGDRAAKSVDTSETAPAADIILHTNNAPVLNLIGDQSIDENKLLEFSVSASDADGDKLVYSVSNLPEGAEFNPVTHVLKWTPDYDQDGAYSNIHFEVTDQDLMDYEDITVTVNDVDITPPVTQDDYDGNWRTSDFIITLTASDTQSEIKETNYRINNGEIKSVSVSGQPLIKEEGDDNILEYWSLDVWDNEELPHKIINGIKLDKAAPLVNIVSPENEEGFSKGPITIEGNVTDELSGAEEVEVYVNSTRYFPELTPSGNFTVTDAEILPGANTITVSGKDTAGNISEDSITVFLGWVLHLKIPSYGIGDYYSGAACLQMVLNYIRNGVKGDLTQEEIYNYGHPYNYPKNSNIAELDPRGIDFTLGHFDPYDTNDPRGGGSSFKAYNFSIETFKPNEFEEYLRDIVHWMAYPVTINFFGRDKEPVAWPNTPSIVPAYADYNHWVVINGASANENPVPSPEKNPWDTPDFTVFGLWLTDPSVQGISREIYITPDVLKETYIFPVVTSDRHNGKYLQIAELPLERSKAKIQTALPNINENTLKLIDIANYIIAGSGIKRHIYDAALVVDLNNDAARYKSYTSQGKEGELLASVFDNSKPSVELDWKGIIDASLFTDKKFRKILDKSHARDFIKVRRSDKENSYYYLIPFDKYTRGEFLTCAAIIIDSKNGSFKQASWVDGPVRFVQINRNKAEKALISKYPNLQHQDNDTDADIELYFELIWEPGKYSSSPFYPYWKITAGSDVYFVTQKEEVIRGYENKD